MVESRAGQGRAHAGSGSRSPGVLIVRHGGSGVARHGSSGVARHGGSGDARGRAARQQGRVYLDSRGSGAWLRRSYDNFAFSNPGRIWIKWNSLNVSFKPSFTSSQLIHGTVFRGNSEVYCVSMVYASNSSDERQRLWKDMSDIAVDISMPWVILGDFNCCRSPHEKDGGSALGNIKTSDFNSLIFNIVVHDLSYVGHYFTWYNQRAENPIHIKLDRMLVIRPRVPKFGFALMLLQRKDFSSKSRKKINTREMR
ncbi:hypothetical protein KFK09_013374 [Dendrobium nobile]|uniref:Endonuclease/exonuclease/phosphatase domain-containing protein n=1 Tax=Dendrobium nobile TaxID=94219 RepID=A0A8T3B9F5_DENNO|nr:hypothetical protein KFK09_013374 [Dendrobium nobile]